MGSATARRYARALFAAASGQDAVDAIAEELAGLHASFADEATRTLVLSPEVPAGVRRRSLEKLTGHSHPLLRNLVQVLLERRREAVLPELQPAFAAMVRESRGELVGRIETARPLDQEQSAALQKAIARLFPRASGIQFQESMNPGLIGGVQVRVGNTLFDGSLRSALEELNERLLGAQIG